MNSAISRANFSLVEASIWKIRLTADAEITTQGGSILTELPAAVLTFVCLTAAALAGLFGAAIDRSPTQDDINTTVRMVANIFVVMTSLVLGLMLNSAKNTFETDNRNVHALATDLILLDRTMKALGPQADEARPGPEKASRPFAVTFPVSDNR